MTPRLRLITAGPGRLRDASGKADSLAFSGALGLIDTECTEIAEGAFVPPEDKLIHTPRVGARGAPWHRFMRARREARRQ